MNAGDYLDLIEKNWHDIGGCGSCGWHALFHEHTLDEYDIEDALKHGGNMQVFCINKDDEYSLDHRGARFNLFELAQEDTKGKKGK